MDKTRAAIVASAGVGLLVSAFVLHKWNHKRRSDTCDVSGEMEVHAVVEYDHPVASGHSRRAKRVADGV